MWLEPDDTPYDLSAEEMGILRRSTSERNLPAPEGSRHSKAQLVASGLVREAFSRDEMRLAGFAPGFVSSHDEAAIRAQEALAVGSPHPSRIAKWQLPVDMPPFRPVMLCFPAGTRFKRKVQPVVSETEPGGALRIVLSGYLACNGIRFTAGEWFFVPNGMAYEFESDPEGETRVLYLYRFASCESGGRFSYEKA